MDDDKAAQGPTAGPGVIPNRHETLEVLRLMGRYVPILMLGGDADGYGARWTIHGAEVQPGIAGYLMEQGYLVDSGPTEMGARKLILTEEGIRFRAEGIAWWNGLGILQRLKIRILG
ncbi:hypothetical protein [Sulfuritalea sp.]|uniref:hypothetical protein n=1 Tax=Sulfuritalea sp. TaxID=2480090 RepID=UPI001ACE2BD1|nr:hypothetical protein [Sulfuritalea sp.]MBN8476641.1 hypothetical protein [Sulfuritalea sp.]